MNKTVQYYHQVIDFLSERLRQGERDIEHLMTEADQKLTALGDLTRHEIEEIKQALYRSLNATLINATTTEESGEAKISDSVMLRVLKESLWQELADITDKTQLEWREVLNEISHHGVYHSGEVVGLGTMICEKCQYRIDIYTPEVLSRCPQCDYDQFQRKALTP